MKRIVTMCAFLMLIGSASATAQWTEVRSYTPFRSLNKPDNLWGLHGLAVDPEGKIWVAPYDVTDTTTIGSGTNAGRREIFVFWPDGTPASFSPVKVLMGDSLNNNNSGRGMASDENGNILYSSFNRIYKINYMTGVAIGKIDTALNSSIAAAATDSLGNIYASRVVGGGQPIKIFGSDLSFLSNAIDAHSWILRSLAVNADGTKLYVPNIYGSKRIWVYENSFGPGFGTYSRVDSVFVGTQAESIGWQPRPGDKPILWASAGSMENPPDTVGVNGSEYMWSESAWYGINTDTKAVVDSIKWGVTFPGNPTFDDTVANAQRRRPRGIVFTASGDTAYVGMFLADSNSVKMFVRTGVGVARTGSAVPEGYTLEQNFPNPFNPQTEIRFSVPEGGLTKLTIYDLVGREVRTLVNKELEPGSYTATFHAENLSSGTYVYVLSTKSARLSRKMLLIK